MAKMKKYCIQILEEDKERRLKHWINTERCSDNLEALIMICPKNFRSRIFDRATGKVVYEP